MKIAANMIASTLTLVKMERLKRPNEEAEMIRLETTKILVRATSSRLVDSAKTNPRRVIASDAWMVFKCLNGIKVDGNTSVDRWRINCYT